MTQLTPPDQNQCQAEKPNGNTFMTMGGRPGLVRCDARAEYVITETKPDEDGCIGSMSVCGPCLERASKTLPAGYFWTAKIIRDEVDPTFSLAEIRNGTGFPRDAKFQLVSNED